MKNFNTLAAVMSLIMVPTMISIADPIPAAILPFADRGGGVKGEGAKVADILFAELATSDSLFLVERTDLDVALKELELNLSGAVSQQSAIQAGHLIGAKIMIMGSVIEASESLYLIAKIVGTETTRVIGARVKGSLDDDIGILTEQLAKVVEEQVSQAAKSLLPPPPQTRDIAGILKLAFGDRKPPSVRISIPEQHVGTRVPDPAVETEIGKIFLAAGFTVLDVKDPGKEDVTITGEALSEFALQRGNLISVRARAEIKAVDRKSGEVLVMDRATTLSVGLGEHVTAKTALQEAGILLAERVGIMLAK